MAPKHSGWRQRSDRWIIGGRFTEHERAQVDARCSELDVTRSSYVRSLILADLAGRVSAERRA